MTAVVAAGYNNFAHEYEMPAFCRLWSCEPIVGWLYMVVFSLVNGDHQEYTHPSSPEKQTHEIDFTKILACLTLGNVEMVTHLSFIPDSGR